MKNFLWHLCGRWHEARSIRALQRYISLKETAEKFFARIGGGK